MYEKIGKLLRDLGINMKYKGYYYLISGVGIALSQGNGKIHITKAIYPNIAEINSVRPYNVEQNIRLAVLRAWSCDTDLLREIFGGKLAVAPSNMEFIEAVAVYFRDYRQQT